MIKNKRFMLISLLLVFSGAASAEQMQTQSPFSSTSYSQGQVQPLQPSSSQTTQPDISQQTNHPPLQEQLPQHPQQPSIEKSSEFERYLAGKVEITDTQLEILIKYEGIYFTQISQPPAGKIAVPVRVIRPPDGAQGPKTTMVEVNAGFLIGTPETVASAFGILGIKSSLVVSTDLKQFGYDLFRQAPSIFAPVEKVPVGPDYVIGPNDEIRITVWGKMEGNWSVTVDRDGNIGLPKLGILGVAGLTFKELKELLHKEFSKYYTGFEMNLSMGALRTIRVYLVGNAENPGAYTVSSLSTLVNALFASGGPGKVGTMRDIQVKRSGKTIAHFDMYDFLLKGDKNNDLRLMPEDVIFIPPVGVLAGIAGSVNKPGIYELKGETKISQLIEMAGGLGTVAFKGRVQVDRIIDNSKQTVFESNLDDIRDKEIMLQPGDLVKIYQVVEDKRIVKLSGAVQREGEYGFKPGMTVKDLISMGSLQYYASNQAELARVKVSQSGPQTARLVIDLSKAMEGDPQHNLALEMNDYLLVRSVPEWQLYKTVTVSGEVKFPGTYTIAKGEKLSSLIERTGGFADKAYLQGAAFTRESVRKLQQKNLDDSIDRLEQQMLSQAAISAQTALSSEDALQQRAVAEQQKAIITKMRAAKAQGRMVIKLDTIDKFKSSVYDVELEDGDSLIVPERPNSVQVIGSVYNSTAFVYEPGSTVSSFINKAGGPTRFAEDKDIFILKVDGSAVSKRQSGMFFMSSRLDPGDTIVVPEQIERIAWMKEVKDITQILYQIAVTAGVLFVAF